MKTLILNGSPKGNSQNCNSRIFAEEFVRNMKNPCEIKCIVKSNLEEIAQYAQSFDTLIIVMPLYIHAMPGIVMKFIEKLKPVPEGKSIGFIVQAGYMETQQHQYLERYLKNLSQELNYNYLGTVSKGQAAAIYMYPNMFKKVLRNLNDLGETFEKTHGFDPEIVKKLRIPYEISKGQLGLLRFVDKIGLGNIFWHKELKKNNGFKQRLDRPYL